MFLVQLVSELYSQAHEKAMSDVKDKNLSFFKTNTTENYIKPAPVNNVYRGLKKPRKSK